MKNSFVNYAHRGASEYTPENTLLAFYLGIYMGANGIETDVQITKDGVLVLFHDDSLERMCNTAGSICDYTYKELNSIFVCKNGFKEKIPTLEDFLNNFYFRPLTFAIELKVKGIAKYVIDILKKYEITDKVILTSFMFDELTEVKKYAPEFKTGFLTSNITDELLCKMKELKIEQICPRAELADEANVKKLKDMGFNVRAWGVLDETLMKKAYDADCDGMTVNFPDKLEEYIKSIS